MKKRAVDKIKVVNVVGARPNFIKIAPLMAEMRADGRMQPILIHTGQHYDGQMSESFFRDLDIPQPDINLEVGSGSHAWQTAEIMKRLEPCLVAEKAELIVVVGDVNSTLAGALTAVKMGIPVAHVEAGLRSFDRTMPEEINRIVTDSISDFLFVTEESGRMNLLREGIPKEKVFFVGNVMIDALVQNQEKIARSPILRELSLTDGDFGVLTLHRPNNVDAPDVLLGLLETLAIIQKEIKVVFPVHPRTRKALEASEFFEETLRMPNLLLTDPLGYLDFVRLVSGAKFVLTDSGGVQEETTFLGIPCLTLRGGTERPVTVTIGTNEIVGVDKGAILEGVGRAMNGRRKWKKPKLWDGQAAQRITNIIIKKIMPLKERG